MAKGLDGHELRRLAQIGVVRQIAAAANRPEFSTTPHELAIATAKFSRKIVGPYQESLRWGAAPPRERAARALHADDAVHAGTHWIVLIELALRLAAIQLGWLGRSS